MGKQQLNKAYLTLLTQERNQLMGRQVPGVLIDDDVEIIEQRIKSRKTASRMYFDKPKTSTSTNPV